MVAANKIHRFYLNFVFCSSILCGFVLAGVLEISNFAQNFWLILSLALVIFSFVIARKYTLILVILAGVLLSFWRFSIFKNEQLRVEKFVGSEILLTGKIAEDPDLNREKGEISLKIDVFDISGRKMNGRIFAKIKTSKTVRRSDEITLRGKMSAGFGGFSGTLFRANVVKITPKSDFVRNFRDFFAEKVRKIIPSPEVDLGLGYLLGQKNSLPADLENALKITALTHIVVASGYNLTVLVNFARKFFGKFSKKLATLAMFALIFGFVLVVGFSPSMTRVGIVAALSVIFWYFGRKVNPYFLLIFVAILTLLISPTNLFDLGWQLSFGSFFGVMILAPLLKKFLFEHPEKLGSSASIFFETLSAQIATLPLLIYTFGAFSLVSLAANMLVLPFVPIAMLLTFLTGIFAWIFAPIAYIFGFFAEMILKFSIFVAKNLASVSGAQMELTLGLSEVLIIYAALILVVIFLEIKAKKAKI